MKNAFAISSLSRQMEKVCEQIDCLAMGVQDTEQGVGDIAGTYQDMLLDELEHIQILALKLTELISQAVGEEQETNTDEGEGSAFAEGELTAVKDKPDGGEDGQGGDEEEPET